MDHLTLDFQKVAEHHGIQLSLTGMAIVFTALATVCIFIALLPRFLVIANKILPEVQHAHSAPKAKRPAAPSSDADEVAAAIAMVMHSRSKGQ